MTVNLKGLVGKMNDATRSALESAAGLCVSRSHYDIKIEHFLVKALGVNGNDVDVITKSFGLDRVGLISDLERSLDLLNGGNTGSPAFSPAIVDALTMAWAYGSIDYGATEIRTGFFLLALLADSRLGQLVQGSCPKLLTIDVTKLRAEWSTLLYSSSEQRKGRRFDEPISDQEFVEGPRVFLSYRHDDSSFYADFLFMSLRAEVPEVRVFRDSDTLKPGMVFSEAIYEAVRKCDVLVAIIGKKWLGVSALGGIRRIDATDDWVRLEVASALAQKKTVIPCLVGGAEMPRAEALPTDIAGVTMRHAVRISQKDLRRDAAELMERLKSWRRADQQV